MPSKIGGEIIMPVATTSLEAFKQHLDKMLLIAQGQLQKHGGIQSYFITNDNDVYDKAPLAYSPEMQDIEAVEVEMICTNPSITSSALLMSVYKLDVLEDEVEDYMDSYKNVTVKDHPDTTEALMVVLYTTDNTYARIMPFKKKESGEYWFGDMGWREAPEIEGVLKNPHKI
jgi:hypothetical protein